MSFTNCYRNLKLSLGSAGVIAGMTLFGMGMVMSHGTLAVMLLVGGSTGAVGSGLTVADALDPPFKAEITLFQKENGELQKAVLEQKTLIASLKSGEISREKQIAVLEAEVDKLRKLYRQTHALVVTLTSTSDDLSFIHAEFAETQEGYEETLDELKKLTDALKKSQFQELDENGDGAVDSPEFERWVQGQTRNRTF